MAEQPLMIPLEAYDPKVLAASLEQLKRDLSKGMTSAGKRAAEAYAGAYSKGGADTAAAKLTQVETQHAEARRKATEQAAKAAAAASAKYADVAAKAIVTSQAVTQRAMAHTQSRAGNQERVWVRLGDRVIEVAKGQEGAFRSMNRQIKRSMSTSEKLRLEMDILARTMAEVGDKTGQGAAAMEGLQRKLDQAIKRETINRGRTLSELIDQQTNAVTRALGPWGHYVDVVRDAGRQGKEFVEKLQGMSAEGERGAASVLALVGVTGTLTAVAAVAGGAILKTAASVADATDELDKLAKSTGVNTQELSQFQQLAEKAVPGGINKIAEGLQKLNERNYDAANGSKEHARTLERLGVAGDTARDQFISLAAGVHRLGNTQERSALLTKLFGDGLARELTPALELGAAGVSKLLRENDRYNRTLTQETIQATARYKDATQELSAELEGLKLRTSGAIDTLTILAKTAQFAVDRPLDLFLDVVTFSQKRTKEWARSIREANRALERQAVAAGRAAEMTDLLNRMSRHGKEETTEAEQAAAEFSGTLEYLESWQQRNLTATQLHIQELRELGAAAGQSEEQIDKLVGIYQEKAQREAEAAKAAREHTEVMREQRRVAAERSEAASAPAAEAETALAVASGIDNGLEASAFEDRIQLQLDFEDATVASIERIVEAELEAERQRTAAAKAQAQQRMDAALAVGSALVNVSNFVAARLQANEKQTAKTRRRAFIAGQISAIGQIAMNTAQAASQALTVPPPPVGIALAAIVSGLGLAQGVIAAQQTPPPQVTHAGGVVSRGPRPSGGTALEVMNRAEVGEGRVSRLDMNSMGGGPGLNSLLLARARGTRSTTQPLPPTVLEQRMLNRSVRRNYLAGGATRQIGRRGIVGMYQTTNYGYG